MRSGRLTAIGLGAALAACAVVQAACGEDEEPQVLKLAVVTSPGVIEFDKERLSAKAGRIVFELTNGKRKGHNIRIHTGDECCHCQGGRGLGGDVRPLRLVFGLAAG